MTFSAVIDGRRYDFEAATSDYRFAACLALNIAGKGEPAAVTIWCEALLPDYGPYAYRIESDRFGRLVVSSL